MKRKILAVLLVLVLSVPCAFAGSNSGFDFHVDSALAFIRGSQLMPMAGISLGLTGPVYGVEAYVLGGIALQPGGSSTGKNVTGEMMSEIGMRFLWRLFANDWTISHFSIDVGYYSQWLQTPSVSNTYYQMHNGIMLRPGISTILWQGHLYQLELGVYYQKTLLPAYSDYDGVVVMLKLF